MGGTNIGLEIRKLRESKGISQEELADMAGLSRPSIVNIEGGKRKVSAGELISSAEIFGLTLDQLVNPSLRPKADVSGKIHLSQPGGGVRVSIPRENYDKFKEVFLYILSRIGAEPHVGQTVLYKILYFIDFDYYEKYEEQLI